MVRSLVFVAAAMAGCGRGDSSRNDTGADEANPPATSTTMEDTDRSGDTMILVVGDSLAAGYGLGDISLSWPALLEAKLREEGHPVSVINGAESGRTTSGGASAIGWYLKRHIDVLVVALGGNDGLRGVKIEAIEKNLETMVTKTRASYPECRVVIAGMRAPPSLGADYCAAFEDVFVRVAKRHDGVLVPFLLDGVAAEPGLNQRDGIHPTAEGQRIVADNVFAVVRTLLDS